MKRSDDVFANWRAHVNGIENFCGIAKSSLTKLRGIQKEKFYLHLEETEWRFNHRYENIYKSLLIRLKKSTLEPKKFTLDFHLIGNFYNHASLLAFLPVV